MTYLDFLTDHNISELTAIVVAAFLVGVSKAGIKGISLIIVTLMAFAVGAKFSTGLVLLLFISGDILAVFYYKHHVQWKQLIALLPWMLGGIILAGFYAKGFPEEVFRKYFSVIISISVLLMLWNEFINGNWKLNRVFAPFMGLMAGITTMLGNMAGVFSNLYFLSTGLPKNQFIGTAAVLFFMVNLFKLPIHVFYWETISLISAKYIFVLLPLLILGFYMGLRILSKVSNELFRKFIIIVTVITALIFLLN